MLAALASPGSLRWVSFTLLAMGYMFWLVGRRYSWGAIAMAAALACGVLTILISSHYLLFVWTSQLSEALYGLLPALPLVYGASLGLFTLKGRDSRLSASLLLASVCAALMLWDGQRLWPAIFYELKGAALGYPPAVLHTPEDLDDHMPPAGTRLIFKTTGAEVSCGLFADSEPTRPMLPYRTSCRDYYWGRAMASPDYSAYTDLPRLYALEELWEEKHPRRLSLAWIFNTLNDLVITDLQRLCPQSDDCMASKQMIVELLGVPNWTALTEDSSTAVESLPMSLRSLDRKELQALLRTLDKDVRAKLEERTAGIVAVYADAQARSIALRDMRPNYSPRSGSPSWSIGNSAGEWPELRDIADELARERPAYDPSPWQNAVLIDVESRPDGGTRLVYHSAVSWQPTAALVAFIAPLIWLVIVVLLLVLRRGPGPARPSPGAAEST